MLALDGVHRRYRGGAEVTDLSLTILPGEIVALVGLNGAGKTTLMRLALGMLRPDRGEVRLFGTVLPRLDPAAWGRVGALVDVPLAYPELTARENLDAVRRLRGAPAGVVADAVAAWRLEAVADRRFGQLSLGNRQRVGLAAALQHVPDLVVLDEPSNGLDPASVILLREHLRARAAAGASILVSSHHLDEVARIADRVVLMNAGRLLGELDTGGVDLERAFFSRIHEDDLARGVEGASR